VAYDISYDHLAGWEADLHLLTERVAGSLFTRPEPRATFADLVRGLLADVPRKNSWQLAEHVGHGSAYRLEGLLGGAKWDAEGLGAVEAQRLRRLARRELQRQHSHADEVGAVDALVGLHDHGLDPQDFSSGVSARQGAPSTMNNAILVHVWPSRRGCVVPRWSPVLSRRTRPTT